MFFFSNYTATTEIYTLSLHDALPICRRSSTCRAAASSARAARTPSTSASRSPTSQTGSRSPATSTRSEEHTSELQSHHDLVCRLLLEKKNTINKHTSSLCSITFIENT